MCQMHLTESNFINSIHYYCTFLYCVYLMITISFICIALFRQEMQLKVLHNKKISALHKRNGYKISDRECKNSNNNDDR